MVRHRRVVAACVLLAGCVGKDQEPPVVVRDSAGVQIVETHIANADDSAVWWVADEPALAIGEANGPEHLLFHQIAGAARLSDGRIVVADRGSSTIRYFGPNGGLLAVTGRPGAGPGEYQAISRIQRLAADSLLVVDGRLGRITILDPFGAPVPAAPVSWPGGRLPANVQRIDDGRWASVYSSPFAATGLVQPGVSRPPAVVMVHRADGIVADTLGAFPGTETSFTKIGEGVVPGITPFGRRLALVAHRDLVYVGTGDDLAYDVFTPEGRHLLRARAEPVDLELESADLDRFRAELLGNIADESQRRELGEFLENAPHPGRKAAYSRLLVDPEGNVWASGYELDPFIVAARWRVFRPDGRYLGVVAMPPDFYLLDIGLDYVLGRGRDALDVETVRMHALHRTAPDDG